MSSSKPAPTPKPVKAVAPATMSNGGSQPATPLAPEPEKALRMAIDISNRLAELLDREQELIIKRKVSEHAELLRTKQRLALDYHASLQVFTCYPQLLKQVSEPLRREARTASERLSLATQRNAHGLRAAILAIQKLTQMIVSLVKKDALPADGYNKMKPGKSTIGQYSPSCTPIVVRRNA
ncbi:MAG: hypothetical protein ABTQ34_07265 [Bdellovibrionales bacterium]